MACPISLFLRAGWGNVLRFLASTIGVVLGAGKVPGQIVLVAGEAIGWGSQVCNKCAVDAVPRAGWIGVWSPSAFPSPLVVQKHTV